MIPIEEAPADVFILDIKQKKRATKRAAPTGEPEMPIPAEWAELGYLSD